MSSIKYDPISTFQWSSNDPSDRFDVVNPATGEVITTVQGGGVAEVDKAVQAAHKAFNEDWRWRSPRERSSLLLKAADRLVGHVEELGVLLSMENGKPVSQAREGDVPFLIGIFQYFAHLVDKLPGEFYDQGLVYATVIREPYGVVAGILPFNWPPIHTGGKAAPALATGNTVILKPGDQCPLTVLRIVEILQEVLPENVVQAVPAAGPDVPRALVAHDLVKKVSFTGSTKAGAAVSKAAADTITPLSLELGGKNAFIVFDDADLDLAVRHALDGGFFNQGEACTAASRVLAQDGIYHAFVERLAEAVKRLKVGHGADNATHVGPVVTKAQQQRVEEYIRLGVTEGAKIMAQAPKPTDPKLANGSFIQPTLFAEVTRDMRIVREEMFGPIVTVTRFDTYREAISATNESDFGLVCGIFTKDTTKAMRAAREIDVGIVFINNYHRGVLGTPFGGAKHSGYGREHCIETLNEYTRAKNIRVPSGVGPIPGWSKLDDIFGPLSLDK